MGWRYAKIGGGGRRHCQVAACAATILLAIAAMLLCLLLFPPPGHHHSASAPVVPPPRPPPPPPFLALCATTPYPPLCLQILVSSATSAPAPASLASLLSAVSSFALRRLSRTSSLAQNLSLSHPSASDLSFLQDCLDLMNSSLDDLSRTLSRLSQLDPRLSSSNFRAQITDVQVWLSSALTDQDTCSEEFQDSSGSIKDQMLQEGDVISQALSIALTFAATLLQSGNTTQISSVPPPAPIGI